MYKVFFIIHITNFLVGIAVVRQVVTTFFVGAIGGAFGLMKESAVDAYMGIATYILAFRISLSHTLIAVS